MPERKIPLILLSLVLSASLVFSSCAFAYPFSGSDKPVSKAIEYFDSVQADDGSIGSYSDTAWVIMALAASGKNPADFGSPSPVDFLRRNNQQLLDSYNITADLARNILAITAANRSPLSFGEGNEVVPGGDYINALKELHDGRQFGAEDSINEDFWAITALIAAGYEPENDIIVNTVGYILDNQGPDKGWSWATPYNEWYMDSDPDNTAAAIIALVNAGVSPSDKPVTDAFEALKGMQGENGGFVSYGVENTSSTAWVVSALSLLGDDALLSQNESADPVDYLLSMQNEDGSVKYAYPLPDGFLALPEKTTAESIIALSGNAYPVKPARTGSFWLWVILVVLITSMIIFLYLNNRRRWK